VLLLAAPSFLVWTILGATSGIRGTDDVRRTRELKVSRKALALGALGIFLVVLASAVRSATQTVAMSMVGRGGMTAGWVDGAMWDPGSYRINLRVAEIYSRRGNCSFARGYARRAVALFPHSPHAKRIRNSCE
jgi:hypothetical protein